MELVSDTPQMLYLQDVTSPRNQGHIHCTNLNINRYSSRFQILMQVSSKIFDKIKKIPLESIFNITIHSLPENGLHLQRHDI